MKVLVLSHMYPSPAGEVVGIFVHEQVKALVETGVEVRVVSPVPYVPFPVNLLRESWKAQSMIPPGNVSHGISVKYPRYVRFPRDWFFEYSGRLMKAGVARAINRLSRGFPFDLIHAHMALPDGYAAALLAERLKKPVIITIHGLDLQHTIAMGPAYREAIRWALTKAHRVVLVSNKLRRIAETHFPELQEKLVVVGNGVDPRAVTHASVQSKHPRLLSVSFLTRQKGVDYNLKALHLLHDDLPDLRYTVIGKGDEEVRLRALSKRLNLAGKVTFLGQLPHARVMEEMANCDVFSLPSWNEAFGIVYLEAMANAKPVIGCAGQGIEDFVRHGETGMLVEPRDEKSLAEAIKYLVTHPEEAQAMGQRAREIVLNEYTWEKNARAMIGLYREALQET